MDERGQVVREVEEPHAGPGRLRVRVYAAGLNPMDWLVIADAELGARFGVRPPTGFGYDFAGVIDEIGEGVAGIPSATGCSAAQCPGRSPVGLRAGDTVLIGGAAGGVGVFAVQLARLAGARVLGTASEASFDFLRGLGAQPVRYGAITRALQLDVDERDHVQRRG